jgi:TonB family protein
MKRAGVLGLIYCVSALGEGPIAIRHLRSGSVSAWSGQTPGSTGRSIGDAMRELQFAELSTEIRFDTKGANFAPWIRRFIAQIKRNWLVPYAAMVLNGRVITAFTVHKDGSITDASVTSPSPTAEFNRAALGAIKSADRIQPLPPEFPAEQVLLTVTFLYNDPPPSRPLPAAWPPPGIYVAGAEGVMPPRVLREEPAQYPPAAAREKIEGSVLLEGIVQPDGSITYVHVIGSLDPTFGLDQEALRAARLWRFSAGTRLGQPVSVVTTLEVAFRLKK